jgi:replicative DNA helicase
MSRGLKLLAKDLHVPVIALSQLSRDIEKRKGEDQRPKLSDLRDSGSIEQDADVILFIHKDAGAEGGAADDGRYELVVAKQRAGRLGSVPVVFERPYARFTELEASSFRL